MIATIVLAFLVPKDLPISNNDNYQKVVTEQNELLREYEIQNHLLSYFKDSLQNLVLKQKMKIDTIQNEISVSEGRYRFYKGKYLSLIGSFNEHKDSVSFNDLLSYCDSTIKVADIHIEKLTNQNREYKELVSQLESLVRNRDRTEEVLNKTIVTLQRANEIERDRSAKLSEQNEQLNKKLKSSNLLVKIETIGIIGLLVYIIAN